MIQGFYSARSALIRKQKGLNVIANNIANINTIGFKKSYASFADALYYEKNKNYPNDINVTYQMGSGTYFTTITRDFTPGAIVETGGKLDLALDQEGFFAIQGVDNEELYTRGGKFTFSVTDDDDVKTIVNELGYSLLDEDGDLIEIPADVHDVTIDLQGDVHYLGQDSPQKIGVVNFMDPTNLEVQSYGIYRQTESSGAANPAEDTNVRQGFLEMSNVDNAYEVVELIKAQRVFSLNSKVVQTVDELASMSNRLRK